ncbi:hypothetical protein ACVC7O_03805 [Roseobacter sp. A03A-229]
MLSELTTIIIVKKRHRSTATRGRHCGGFVVADLLEGVGFEVRRVVSAFAVLNLLAVGGDWLFCGQLDCQRVKLDAASAMRAVEDDAEALDGARATLIYRLGFPERADPVTQSPYWSEQKQFTHRNW